MCGEDAGAIRGDFGIKRWIGRIHRKDAKLSQQRGVIFGVGKYRGK